MSVETLVIDGRTLYVTYDSFPEERPSLYSAGSPEMICVTAVKFKDGTDALPWIMSIDDETEEQTCAWVERLLDRRLITQGEDAADSKASDRMDEYPSGRWAGD